MIVCSPSLYLTVTACPLLAATVAPTAPLVMVELGAPSQGLNPSPVPRMDSAKMCTSIAICKPSGCGIAPLPMYDPGLMSAIVALTTATTNTLSASLSVNASPMLDFANTARPSSFSIVPRNRIVCGCGDAACCASAAHVAAAPSSAAAIVIRVGLISAIELKSIASAPHAVIAKCDIARLQSAVRIFRGEGQDLLTRSEIGDGFFGAGGNLGRRRHQDLLLAILVLHSESLAVLLCDQAIDCRVGHRAISRKIPRPMALGDAALRLSIDV